MHCEHYGDDKGIESPGCLQIAADLFHGEVTENLKQGFGFIKMVGFT